MASRRSSRRRAQAQAQAARRPPIGKRERDEWPAFAQHKKTGDLYVMDFRPDTEERDWVRYDTFATGTWREYPRKTARDERDLVRVKDPCPWRYSRPTSAAVPLCSIM